MVAENNNKPRFSEQVDLSALIMGFSTAALHYLGETPVGSKEVAAPNLGLAKQNIDIIQLIQEKTKGNCTPDEDQLIRHVLNDLMFRYVNVREGRSKSK